MRRDERGGKKVKTKEKENLSLVLSTLNSAKAEIEEVQTNKDKIAAETKSAVLAREKAVNAKIALTQELEDLDEKIISRQHEFDKLSYKISVSQDQLQNNLIQAQKLLEQEQTIRNEHAALILQTQEAVARIKATSEKELKELEDKKKSAQDDTNNLAKHKAALELILEEVQGQTLKEEEKTVFLEKRVESLNKNIDRLWDEFTNVQEMVKTENHTLIETQNKVLEKEKELEVIKQKIFDASDELKNIKLRIVGAVDREKEVEFKANKLKELYKDSGLVLKI